MIHTDPDLILSENAHRPYPLSERRWNLYQEWKQVLFINWQIEPHLLNTKFPKGITLDLYDNKAYLSLVCYRVQKTRRRIWLPLPGRGNFIGLHLRTYVTDGKQPGVHLLDIQVNKRLPAIINSLFTGIPYEKTELERIHNGYYLINKNKEYALDTEYTINNPVLHKSPLESWLTNRYCYYQRAWGQALRYPLHHQNWPLRQAGISHAKINFPIAGTLLTEKNIESVYFSPGVNVLLGKPERI